MKQPHDQTSALFVILGALLLLVALVAAARADSTVYGPDGRVIARQHTDSAGNVTTYGPDGKPHLRTHTDSQGTTTYYDPATGKALGRKAPSKPDKSK